MKFKNRIVAIMSRIFLFVVFSFSAFYVFAGGGDPNCLPGKVCNPISVDSVNGLIKTLLEGLLKIGIPIVALAIIYAGFLFVVARGNSEKLETAKKTLLYSILGAGILLGAWAIAQLISDTVLGL